MARHCGVLPDNPGNGQLLRSCPPELTAGQGCQSQEPARELGQQLPQAPQAPLGQHTPHGCTRVHSRVREKACCPHACACVCMCACVHACLCVCMSACLCVCPCICACGGACLLSMCTWCSAVHVPWRNCLFAALSVLSCAGLLWSLRLPQCHRSRASGQQPGSYHATPQAAGCSERHLRRQAGGGRAILGSSAADLS